VAFRLLLVQRGRNKEKAETTPKKGGGKPSVTGLEAGTMEQLPFADTRKHMDSKDLTRNVH
jgi:hypothetical protein